MRLGPRLMRVPTSVLHAVRGTVLVTALATGCSVGPSEKVDEAPCATSLLVKIHYAVPTPPPLPPEPELYDTPPPCGRG